MMYSGKGKLPKAKSFRSVLPGCMVNSHATVVPGAGRSAAVIQTLSLLLLARGIYACYFYTV